MEWPVTGLFLACSACYWLVPWLFRLLLTCSLLVPLVTGLFRVLETSVWHMVCDFGGQVPAKSIKFY